MPGVTRDDGTDTVGGGFIVEGSPNVFVEGKPAVRVGDRVAGHGRGGHGNATMMEGSGNVFVNGISVCREGDRATCGHPATGSSSVFAN